MVEMVDHKPDKEEIILRSDGKPFADSRSAAMQKGKLEKDGIITKIIDSDGGYALEVTAIRRPQRIPLGKRNILTAKPQEGFVLRFVNDREDRVQVFKDAGWEPAPKTEVGDQRLSAPVQAGSATAKPVGGGVTAVLMRKRKDWFDEDYAEKMAKIDKAESAFVGKATGAGRYGEIKREFTHE